MRKIFVLLLVFFVIALILASVSVSVSVSGQHPLKKDTDGDYIPDEWESEHWLDPYNAGDASLDYNYNGLTNLQEYINDYDPWDKDTDEDGISNYAEWFGLFGFFTDPLASDTDEDGLSDLEEICMYIDTGNQSQMDEIYPDETDREKARAEITSMRKEYRYKLDPTNSDMDGDGLNDGDEISRGTNPNRADTDYDGLSDGDEVNKYKTDPTKRDTDGDGLMDSEEVFGTYGVVTDPNNADSDGDGIPDGEERFGFGFAPIAPSKHALTYEEFISSNAYAGEYITVKAKVGVVKRDIDQTNFYLLYLKPLKSADGGVGNRGVARVNSSWHVNQDRMHVDDRFDLILCEGETIVVVGVAGNIRGSNREIAVDIDSGGKMYLVLSQEEARARWERGERWFPSKGYVKILPDSEVTPVTITVTVTPSSMPSPTSTSTPSSSPVNATNETNATAAGEPGAGAEGKGKGSGIFGLLGYVAIGIVIVIAALFLYAKFDRSRRSRKVRKEGEGGKGGKGGKPSAEVSGSGMQKGTRKEWG